MTDQEFQTQVKPYVCASMSHVFIFNIKLNSLNIFWSTSCSGPVDLPEIPG